MKVVTYLNILYDYYGELLSDKQRSFFEDYYFNNLSLSEISENNKISRNAVHKQIKSIEVKLKEYESKLKLYEKSIKLNKIIDNIKDEALKNKLKELE
ncbi:MAG: sigma factor-like helix-turn-helix DNA-binding protein [Bacilli bacterium]